MRLTLKVAGHLSLPRIREVFDPIEGQLRRSGTEAKDLLVDLAAMEGYDVEAREWFINDWSPRCRPLIRRFAVVTKKTSWRVITTTIGLVTRTQMRAFETTAEAEAWITKP